MTKKEIQRIQRTDDILTQWKNNGYTYSEKTVSILFANIMAFVLCAPFCLLELWIYSEFGGNFNSYGDNIISLLVFLGITLVGFFIHECIHWVFMGLFAGSWKNVELGFLKEKLTPYCTCQEPLQRWQYAISLIMPMFILGVTATVLAAIYKNPYIMMFGIIHTFGGGGDLTIVSILLFYKKKTKEMFVIDHPIKCGFYAIEKEYNK